MRLVGVAAATFAGLIARQSNDAKARSFFGDIGAAVGKAMEVAF